MLKLVKCFQKYGFEKGLFNGLIGDAVGKEREAVVI